MKYQHKPTIIEAWRWMFAPSQEPSPAWANDALWRWPAPGGIHFAPDHPDGPRIEVATLDAVAILSPGDYLVKGSVGELYPCKPDIFDAIYEPVAR